MYLCLYLAENRGLRSRCPSWGLSGKVTRTKYHPEEGAASCLYSSLAQAREPEVPIPNTNFPQALMQVIPLKSNKVSELRLHSYPDKLITYQASAAASSISGQFRADSCPPSKLSCSYSVTEVGQQTFLSVFPVQTSRPSRQGHLALLHLLNFLLIDRCQKSPLIRRCCLPAESLREWLPTLASFNCLSSTVLSFLLLSLEIFTILIANVGQIPFLFLFLPLLIWLCLPSVCRSNAEFQSIIPGSAGETPHLHYLIISLRPPYIWDIHFLPHNKI